MSVSTVSGNANWFVKDNQLPDAGHGFRVPLPGPAGLQAAYGPAAARTAGAGLMGAIAQALSQVGVRASADARGDAFLSSPASVPGSTVGTDGGAALGVFVQSLLQALHAQGASLQKSDIGASSDLDANGAFGAAADIIQSAQGSGRARAQADVQGLLQALATSGRGAPAAAASADRPPSTLPAATLATLESSFQNLLGPQDAVASPANLGNFLVALSRELGGASPLGGAISAQA